MLEAPQGNRQRVEAYNFGVESPCYEAPGSGVATPYYLARLPANDQRRLMTVGAAFEAYRVFALHVSLLDEAGEVVRSFGTEDFNLVGPRYAIQVTPRDEYHYVLITADPELIGKSVDRLTLGINSSYVSTGAGYGTTVQSGADSAGSHQFSYDGSVMIGLLNSGDTE